MKHYILSLALLSLLSIPLNASTLITFSDQTTFDSQFPVGNRATTGGSSSVTLLTSPDRLDLHAQQASGDGTTTARMTIYTASNSAFDFLSTPLTFTFNTITSSFFTSGTTYTEYLGVFSGNHNGITAPSGPDDGVFFSIANDGSNALKLLQRFNGATSTLNTWSLGTNGFSFSSLSMTIDGASWLVSAVSSSGATFTGSGTITNTINTSNWGSTFAIGLQSDETTNNISRFTDMQLGSISVVPEPRVVSMMVGTLMLMLVTIRRRTLRFES